MDELWKDVRNWDGKYLISNHGKLKSINGKYSKKHPDGYITIGCIDSVGYRVFTMRRPGFKERVRAHTLVCNAFNIKPISEIKLCVNHLDGNKLNNNHTNLEWCTGADNIKHAVATGLMNLKGENHYNCKLSNDKVIEMRRVRKEGWTYQKIGDYFGVDRRQASDVVRGVNWGWLKEGL